MIFQITLAHTASHKHAARTEVDRGREEVRLGAGADAGARNGWDELDWGGGRRRNGCRVAAAWADVQRTREGR